MHIEQLEAKLAGSIPESNDPVERDNWRRLLEVIPDKVVVEVLLEYLVLEVSNRFCIELTYSVTGYGPAGMWSSSGKGVLIGKALLQP